MENRNQKNRNGKNESIFLKSIESILSNNKTKAELTLEKFKINNNLDFLYDQKK